MRWRLRSSQGIWSGSVAQWSDDDGDLESSEGAATAGLDSLANPTDTKGTLALGQTEGSALRTNTCEITMKVEAGFQYDVIATSQLNLVNKDKTRHVSDGGYRVSVLPLEPEQAIPE